MAITAAQVKELRERTGAGMMECKKALVECNGDMDAAIDTLRKNGQAKADKKSGRTASEGRIVFRIGTDGGRAVLVEINCETDFVAKDENFVIFSEAVAERILAGQPDSVSALAEMPLQEGESVSVDDTRKALIAKLGENINVRRFACFDDISGIFGSYLHGMRIGVMVELEGGDEALARDIAMHVAASRPVCVSEDDVPPSMIEKEKEIFTAQAEQSGKPADIIEKMVTGRIRKFLKETTLLGQPFVKEPDITVEKLLKNAGASVIRFERMEVGEGIEKKEENFAEEVMAQVQR